ncbi:MAG: VWA domain-containing protein [Bacteroidota bacterium]
MMIHIKRILFFVGIIIIAACSFTDKNNPVVPKDTDKPNTPFPIDGALQQENLLTLSWVFAGSDSFHVYLDDVNPPVNIAAKVKSKTKAVVYVSGTDKIYYWKVVAIMSNGSSIVGPVWRFSTKSQHSTEPGFVLEKHSLTTTPPSDVELLFQVLDMDGKGITDLTVDDFYVYENDKIISYSESNLTITKREENKYKQKVVLLLDNSTSITQDPENPNNLQLLKDAAKGFVDNMTDQQEISVYKFSSAPEQLIGFTTSTNKAAINSAIDNIGVGYATTNLYGSIIETVDDWKDFISLDSIIQGTLIVFTDGDDTQGSKTLQQALSAIGDKHVYTVGLGSEIDPETLEIIGNQSFIGLTDITELSQALLDIQSEIKDFSNSFYWLRYRSPKRGNNIVSLLLLIKDNPIVSKIEWQFSSSKFFDPAPGIYVSSTVTNPTGSDDIILKLGGEPAEVTLRTYGGAKTPLYTWEDHPFIIRVVSDPPTNSKVQVQPAANATVGLINIKVTDTENSFDTIIKFNISN